MTPFPKGSYSELQVLRTSAYEFAGDMIPSLTHTHAGATPRPAYGHPPYLFHIHFGLSQKATGGAFVLLFIFQPAFSFLNLH